MKNAKNGFTLIELTIYSAIAAGVTISLVLFSISISNTREKTYVAQEVNANGRMAIDIISRTIRASNGVNLGSCIFDSDPGKLSLSMSNPLKNPTIIDLTIDNGILQIKQGTSDPVAVTSDEVKISNLTFKNLTTPEKRENISAEITIEYNNPSEDIIYDFYDSWKTSVSLRQ